MKHLFVSPASWLRFFFPLVHRTRAWAQKFHDRAGTRLVISGGKVRFMDAELNFPEQVGMTYSTPLFWNGPEVYEGPTSRTIARCAGRSKLFLDIGSNIGIYAVYVGVKYPQVKTIAFEPVPAIRDKNRAFHRANLLSDQGVQSLALSDHDGTQKMYIPAPKGIEEEQTATLRGDSWQAYEKRVETLEVQIMTLDSFAAANALPDGPCCLKIDVENHEAGVLRGGKKFISGRRPWIICELLPLEELDPATRTLRNNNRETLALLGELRYTPFAITGEGFFRMTAADFGRPRTLKDFLLVPNEKVGADVSFFTLESLEDVFPV